MKTITFVTGNAQKFERIQQWIHELDPSIHLEQAKIEIPEYQSLDLYEVARGKVFDAWRKLQKPVIIDDGGLYIERLNNFPGTLSKYVFQGIGLEGVWLLAEPDPRASFRMTIAYTDNGKDCHFFDGVMNGRLIKPLHPVKNKTMPYTEIFVPDGYDKPLAELGYEGEVGKKNHRYLSVKKFVEWLQQKQK